MKLYENVIQETHKKTIRLFIFLRRNVESRTKSLIFKVYILMVTKGPLSFQHALS
jgi:hypothetical protein